MKSKILIFIFGFSLSASADMASDYQAWKKCDTEYADTRGSNALCFSNADSVKGVDHDCIKPLPACGLLRQAYEKHDAQKRYQFEIDLQIEKLNQPYQGGQNGK